MPTAHMGSHHSERTSHAVSQNGGETEAQSIQTRVTATSGIISCILEDTPWPLLSSHQCKALFTNPAYSACSALASCGHMEFSSGRAALICCTPGAQCLIFILHLSPWGSHTLWDLPSWRVLPGEPPRGQSLRGARVFFPSRHFEQTPLVQWPNPRALLSAPQMLPTLP
jgi:hypothetical protein